MRFRIIGIRPISTQLPFEFNCIPFGAPKFKTLNTFDKNVCIAIEEKKLKRNQTTSMRYAHTHTHTSCFDHIGLRMPIAITYTYTYVRLSTLSCWIACSHLTHTLTCTRSHARSRCQWRQRTPSNNMWTPRTLIWIANERDVRQKQRKLFFCFVFTFIYTTEL